MKKDKIYTFISLSDITSRFGKGNGRSCLFALAFAASALAGGSVLSSCATRQVSPLTVSPSPLAIMPDAGDSVRMDVVFNVPENYLTRRSRVVITPQLMSGDSVYGEYTPVVLDASIYRKKVERLEVLDGYNDPYVGEARLIDNRESYEIPYTRSIVLPEGVAEARIRAVVSTDGCGECTGTDTLTLAEVMDPMSFFRSEMRLVSLNSEFVVRPKIREGKGVANLQFVINRFDIKMDMGNNAAEMEKMLNTLRPILNDSLSVLNKLDIVGIASADGSLAFNTTLSRNRALSAKEWLSEKLHLPYKVQQLINVKSRPEGWEPVLEAMRRAGDKDTVAVASILEKYADKNDDVQEYHIRRLPAWNRIKDNYLQKDRVVEYQYAYTVKSFTTDAQLLSLYRTRPDAFSEEELLRVSRLVKTDSEREDVYLTVLRYYPHSEEAANNLALICLEDGRLADAQVALTNLGNRINPVVANTLAVTYHRNGRTADAMALLENNTSLPEARYNLGVMKAESGEFEEAYTLLAPFADTNAAILALRTGRKAEARKIIKSLPKDADGVEQLRGMTR